jgi:parallel beta-helix repeat protein
VRKNRIHHNGQLGIAGYKLEDALVEENEIAFNNTAGFSRSWEAGASKFVYARNLTIRANFVHDNYGNGLWTDGDGFKVVFEDNRAVRQDGNGIHHEVGCDAVIRGNTVRDNGGAGIAVTASQNVDIRNNVAAGNEDGIVLWHQFRETDPGSRCEWTLKNVSVLDNKVTMRHGWTGLAWCCGAPGGDAIYSLGTVRFRGNTYYLGSNAEYFYWLGGLGTETEWVTFGNDVDGRFIRLP